MNFTREPIIETILSPKDGCKLCIRNSKITGAEELFVDAVEVVSFGQAFFFRGQERPKPFLVPVSDYEVFEVKETRVVLKNITHERNIKIGGGRDKDSPVKAPKQVTPEKVEDAEKQIEDKELTTEVVAGVKTDKKRDRRRNRRKRVTDEKKEPEDQAKDPSGAFAAAREDGSSEGEVKVTSAIFTHLLPPPTVLISETLGRLREKEAAEAALLETLGEGAVAVSQKVSEKEESVEPIPEKETPEIPKGEDFFN